MPSPLETALLHRLPRHPEIKAPNTTVVQHISPDEPAAELLAQIIVRLVRLS